MDRKQIFGLVGSVILFLGVFAPFMSLPIVGSMNYFQNGKGDGLIILIIAVASFVLTLTNRYKWLSVTGLVSLGILIYTFINIQLMVSELSSELNTELQDNPFKGIGDLALQSIQIQWGWALLLIGSGLLLAAGILELISSYKSNRNLKQFVPYVAVTALVVFSVIAISHFNKNHPKFKSEQSESLNKAKNKNDERKIQYINPPSSNQEIQKIKKEIKRIPKNEYGQEPSSPCRDEDSPGGRGYYKVGTELLIGDSLSEAVYVARGYCTTMFGGSQRTYCKSGVDMAIRNMSNVQKCYKELFNMDVPNPTD